MGIAVAVLVRARSRSLCSIMRQRTSGSESSPKWSSTRPRVPNESTAVPRSGPAGTVPVQTADHSPPPPPRIRSTAAKRNRSNPEPSRPQSDLPARIRLSTTARASRTRWTTRHAGNNSPQVRDAPHGRSLLQEEGCTRALENGFSEGAAAEIPNAIEKFRPGQVGGKSVGTMHLRLPSVITSQWGNRSQEM